MDHVAEELRATKKDTSRRKYTDEEKAQACHEAALTSTEAASETLGIPLQIARKTGKYPQNAKRGRRAILTKEEEAEVDTYVSAMEVEGEDVFARDVAAIARGVIRKTRPHVLESFSGDFVVGKSWAISFLKHRGYSVMKATTDRLISDVDIVAGGSKFFDDVEKASLHSPELTFNIDETFALYQRQCRGLTWYKRRAGKQVIRGRRSKHGFTMTPVICADGTITAVQLIFKGKSKRCAPKVMKKQMDDRIKLMWQPKSHFQTSDTFAQLLKEFAKAVVAKRMRLGLPNTARAVVIFDGASCHCCEPDLENNIHVVRTPPSMTHVFQPLDQLALAELKASIDKQFLEDLEKTVATGSSPAATVHTVYGGGLRKQKRTKYLYLAKALRSLKPNSIIASFEMTGILRRAFNKPPMRPVVYDGYVERAGTQPDVLAEWPLATEQQLRTVFEDEVADVTPVATPVARRVGRPRAMLVAAAGCQDIRRFFAPKPPTATTSAAPPTATTSTIVLPDDDVDVVDVEP